MVTNNNELVLKPVSDLLSNSFFVPAYQRNYRWTSRQVTDLLDDISEFQKESESSPKGVFYCLQPIVVKAKGSEWELVDGQQRLTTIYIILSYLLDIVTLLGKKRYTFNYETRPKTANFLANINEDEHKECIDYFHMFEAKKAVQDWFEQRDGTYKIKFLQTLLNDDDTGKNVKVIWYQINEDIDVTAVFTRLNLGKIPLKNAELVKALFLKGNNFDDNDRYLTQLKIAQEWDEIERSLQSDAFWFFINNDNEESNRIEFILNLVAREISSSTLPKISDRDPFFVFLTFAQWLSVSNELIEQNWQIVKRCNMVLREWYEDRTLFHLIGFLVSRETSVLELLKLFNKCDTKQIFRYELTNLVFKKTFPILKDLSSYESKEVLKDDIADCIEQLSYSSSKHQLVSVLLLFNIATLLANVTTNSRFQFDQFKKESWDIEHIRSVASEMPRSKDRQKLWLDGVVQYIQDQYKEETINNENELNEILAKCKNLLTGETFDSISFENLFNQVLEIYMPDSNEEVDNSIGNLTLLDSSTNRSYQNAIFPIKRNRIIKLDKSATFVPICTKNAFLKYYSNRVDNIMFWHVADSENHQMAMVELLTELFAKQVQA